MIRACMYSLLVFCLCVAWVLMPDPAGRDSIASAGFALLGVYVSYAGRGSVIARLLSLLIDRYRTTRRM